MIETERLILRPPQGGDGAAIVAMLTDAETMADLRPGMTREQAEGVLAKHDAYRAEGLGFLAVVRREDGVAVGFCGLKRGEPHSPIAGKAETGWLVAAPWWRRGYAGEAMRAILDTCWDVVAEDRIYAITSLVNGKSQAMMERLGMHRLADGDFLSASFAEGDRLRPSLTYAMDRPRA